MSYRTRELAKQQAEAQTQQPVESKIVQAVGVAVSSGYGKELAARMEQAMSDAVLQANAEGIPVTDSEKIRTRMLEARERVLNEARQEANKKAQEANKV